MPVWMALKILAWRLVMMCFVPFVNYWRSAPIWAWPLLVAGLPLQPLLTAYHSAQKLQGCAAQIAKNYPPQFFVICLALQFAGRYVTGVSPLAQPHARIMAQPCALIRWYISGQSGATPPAADKAWGVLRHRGHGRQRPQEGFAPRDI